MLIAGEHYGTGSSRDWAAKALALLRVRAILRAGGMPPMFLQRKLRGS